MVYVLGTDRINDDSLASTEKMVLTISLLMSLLVLLKAVRERNRSQHIMDAMTTSVTAAKASIASEILCNLENAKRML